MNDYRHGFRIIGPCTERRRLVDWARAFDGYASCDERAEVDREGYLSAFAFGGAFREHLEATGSPKDFAGGCWAPWVWFDIDRADDLERARRDAARLALTLVERLDIDGDALLLFYSGSKGLHIGLPTALWGPEPSAMFHRAARAFCQRIADAVSVVIDAGIYDKVRAFRAPNSRHPKTGLHKRRVTLDELMALSVEEILRRAERPEPFELPATAERSERAAADWAEAMAAVEQQATGRAQRRASGTPKLNRATLDFIREGAAVGERHRLLFSAAANLAEFGCPAELAHALLTEAGLDCGLPPSDVRRQIDCGLAHGAGTAPADSGLPSPAGDPPPVESPPPVERDKLRAQLATLWGTPASARADDDTHQNASRANDGEHCESPAGVRESAGEPPGRGVGKDAAPILPPGAKLHYHDARLRPCPAHEATAWTWEGADQWYPTAQHPVPTVRTT